MRRNVDFPHPEGPISETNSPGKTSRSMSSSARTSLVALGHAADRRAWARYPSCHVLRRAVDHEALGQHDDREERIPSAAATTFVAHSDAGEVM